VPLVSSCQGEQVRPASAAAARAANAMRVTPA
jgi:hypothetical protein